MTIDRAIRLAAVYAILAGTTSWVTGVPVVPLLIVCGMAVALTILVRVCTPDEPDTVAEHRRHLEALGTPTERRDQ